MRGIPEFQVWRQLRYELKGIKVCNRWSGSYDFCNFIADMGPRPSPEYRVGRRDLEGPYSPENCFWIKRSELKKIRDCSEYNSWRCMWRRCTTPKNPEYFRYGGRGIRICDRWKSFDLFMIDMGAKPTPQHQIDRINNDGNYTIKNCRWATPKENTDNRRCTILIKMRGESHSISEWARLNDLIVGTVFARLKYGWSMEDAVFTPLRQKRGTRKQ